MPSVPNAGVATNELMKLAEDVGRSLAPMAHDGPAGRVNRPLVKELASSGLLGRLYRPEGISALELCAMRRGLARTCTAAETTLAVQGLGSIPIVQSAHPETAKKWIPGVADGSLVAAFALTEQEAGSDAAQIALRAEPDGDGYRLTGEKRYISHAPDADVYTVFARTTLDAGARGVTAFAVERDSPGLGGQPINLLSPHPIGTVTFDNVFVPKEHVLGDVNAGFRVAMRTLDLFRPSVGAFAVGMGEAALSAAIDYSRQREAFGQPISGFQAVSHKLADMATRLHAAWLLVEAAAQAYDAGTPSTGLSAMAKLDATEAAQFAIDASIQIHGAVALEDDHLLAHLYRDVRATRIYEGTSEIQRNLIARELLADRLGPLAVS